MNYWEIIADNLSKPVGNWGCVSAIDSNERTIWIADAHRDGKRFVVRADEKLTAFVALESAIHRAKAQGPLTLPPDDRIGARGPLAVFGTYLGTLLQDLRIRMMTADA